MDLCSLRVGWNFLHIFLPSTCPLFPKNERKYFGNYSIVEMAFFKLNISGFQECVSN